MMIDVNSDIGIIEVVNVEGNTVSEDRIGENYYDRTK